MNSNSDYEVIHEYITSLEERVLAIKSDIKMLNSKWGSSVHVAWQEPYLTDDDEYICIVYVLLHSDGKYNVGDVVYGPTTETDRHYGVIGHIADPNILEIIFTHIKTTIKLHIERVNAIRKIFRTDKYALM